MPGAMRNASWPRVAAVLAISCLAGTSGCKSSKTAYSGFLRDYSGFKESAGLKGALVYLNPNRHLIDYDKFMVDPIVFHFAPNAKGTAIDSLHFIKVAKYGYEELVKRLAEKYQVVNEPGVGMLRLCMAITDIEKTTPAMNIHPATKGPRLRPRRGVDGGGSH
ncbi:MAG: DUF3313 family protein [Planctomycetota bacterium]|jgi:hypothetical protein